MKSADFVVCCTVGMLPILYASNGSSSITTVGCTRWPRRWIQDWPFQVSGPLGSDFVRSLARADPTSPSGIVIFFCVTYGPGVNFPSWWGNDVWQNTYDNNGTSWLDIPAVGYFGPPNGTWS